MRKTEEEDRRRRPKGGGGQEEKGRKGSRRRNWSAGLREALSEPTGETYRCYETDMFHDSTIHWCACRLRGPCLLGRLGLFDRGVDTKARYDTQMWV